MSLFLASAMSQVPAILDVLADAQRIEVVIIKIRHACADDDAADRLVAVIETCAAKGAPRAALFEWAKDRLLEGNTAERIARHLDATWAAAKTDVDRIELAARWT